MTKAKKNTEAKTPPSETIPKTTSRFDLTPTAVVAKPPPRLLLYGEPGIGKTTFGCNAPGAVLIPTEDGSLAVTHVPRLPNDGKAKTAEDIIHALDFLIKTDHDRKWVVVDTFNGACGLVSQKVCDRDFGGRWESTKGEEGYNAWGRGPKATAQEMRSILARLDTLQQRKNMGVILLAHTGLQKSSNAMGADFYKFSPDLERPVAAAVISWADQVGYAGYEVHSATRAGEHRAKASRIGSERYIWFEGEPGRDAKSRVGYEMPSKIMLNWDEYERYLAADPLKDLVEQAKELIPRLPDSDKEAIIGRIIEATGEREVNTIALVSLGAGKLQTMIGWMLSKLD